MLKMMSIIHCSKTLFFSRRSFDRNVSIERDPMNRHNGLPKPYSMMNLGADEGDVAPPKARTTRKKKEVLLQK